MKIITLVIKEQSNLAPEIYQKDVNNNNNTNNKIFSNTLQNFLRHMDTILIHFEIAKLNED